MFIVTVLKEAPLEAQPDCASRGASYLRFWAL